MGVEQLDETAGDDAEVVVTLRGGGKERLGLPLSECAGEGTGGNRWSETSAQHGRSGSIKPNIAWRH